MITVRDISKSYDSLKVLSDVNLDINKGEVVSIVGPSGAGKTTLLQIIGTLDRPDTGTVKYDGEDVLAMKDSRLAKFHNAQSESYSSFISFCLNLPCLRMWPCLL